MDKGKYVSRSTYQKVVEENKKLLADLKVLTTEFAGPDFEAVFLRWKHHFEKNEQFDRDLREILQYGKQSLNPQSPNTTP